MSVVRSALFALALVAVLSACSKPSPLEEARIHGEEARMRAEADLAKAQNLGRNAAEDARNQSAANLEQLQRNVDETRRRGNTQMADEMQKVLDDSRRVDQTISRH